ncbi:hypothetical protein TNIN_408501 [Trichonephila inaurata madagascariensis]|uniref:Uncharacterized protein n=1 Tax=Trichonephila inaurata madagascariensis TaxID=2747483 RepID=A0A8X6YHK2_9ARAC|nr:hypothetical protein TNIN_408501 [Trichonephila inaurata madagascariensis]
MLSETWLDNDERVSIPNFDYCVQFKRPRRRAAGAAIYRKQKNSHVVTPHMNITYRQTSGLGKGAAQDSHSQRKRLNNSSTERNFFTISQPGSTSLRFNLAPPLQRKGAARESDMEKLRVELSGLETELQSTLDNGTNFVGLNDELQNIDRSVIIAHSDLKISWHFNPPTTAWCGGCPNAKRIAETQFGKSFSSIR